jgi:hypothetical protein
MVLYIWTGVGQAMVAQWDCPTFDHIVPLAEVPQLPYPRGLSRVVRCCRWRFITAPPVCTAPQVSQTLPGGGWSTWPVLLQSVSRLEVLTSTSMEAPGNETAIED